MAKLDLEEAEGGPRATLSDDATLQAALVDMQDAEFCNSARWQEQQWRADRTMVDLGLLDFEKRFINRMRNMYKVPLFCHTARRTVAEQSRLLEEGFSKVFNGPHLHGMAIDVIHSTKAWGLSRAQWSILGHVGKEVAKDMRLFLTWGGDWKNPYDPAHWEINQWRKRT